MDEIYLVSGFIVALLAVIFFKKESDLPASSPSSNSRVVTKTDSSGISGVAKYLQDQQSALLESEGSSVEKYLEKKQSIEDAQLEEQRVSGVAKYLEAKKAVPLSSVSKYMARKAIYSKEMAKKNVSGVQKYLNSRD